MENGLFRIVNFLICNAIFHRIRPSSTHKICKTKLTNSHIITDSMRIVCDAEEFLVVRTRFNIFYALLKLFLRTFDAYWAKACVWLTLLQVLIVTAHAGAEIKLFIYSLQFTASSIQKCILHIEFTVHYCALCI